MTNLASLLIGLLFLQRNSTILDMRQGILNFPFFSMQLKNEDRTDPNVIEPTLNPVDTILQRTLNKHELVPMKFVLVEAGSAVNWSITRKGGAMRIK